MHGAQAQSAGAGGVDGMRVGAIGQCAGQGGLIAREACADDQVAEARIHGQAEKAVAICPLTV